MEYTTTHTNLIPELIEQRYLSTDISYTFTFRARYRATIRFKQVRLYRQSVGSLIKSIAQCLRNFKFVPEGKSGVFHYHLSGIIKKCRYDQWVKFLQFWQRKYGHIHAVKSKGPLYATIYYHKEDFHREMFGGELKEIWRIITPITINSFITRFPKLFTKGSSNSRNCKKIPNTKNRKRDQTVNHPFLMLDKLLVHV